MNNTKNHTLINAQTNQIFKITLSNNKIITEAGIIGKVRSTHKEFSTNNEAVNHFLKKEWEMLKKGFILHNSSPNKGEPYLHYYVGAGYTGCLSFQDTPKGIYIYKHGWFKSATDQRDFLILIDDLGTLEEEIELPKILAWDMHYSTFSNSLLLDLDHSIFEYKLASGQFYQLANGENKLKSFISVRADKIAFSTGQTIFVINQHNNTYFKQSCKIELAPGATPFCTTLSKHGNILAIHTSIGTIQLFDILKEKVISTIHGSFGIIDQLEFVDNDNLLVAKEQNGTYGMRYFDLKTNTEVEFKTLELPSYSKNLTAFCLNSDQSILALIQDTTAYIYNFSDKKYLFSFEIDHAIKTVNPKFIGDKLGIRTDYGCFSLYSIK